MNSSISPRLGGRGATAWKFAATSRGHAAYRRVRRPPSRRTAIAGGAIVAALAVAASTLWWAPFLQVEEINVQGADATYSARILQAASITKGEPLVEVDPNAVTERISATGLVAGVHVARRWPSGLAITVASRVPVFAVATSSSEAMLVDIDGVGFDRVAARGLSVPVAKLSDPNNAAQRVAAAQAVASLLPAQRKDLRSLTIEPSGIISMTLGQVQVRWGDVSDGALKAQVVEGLRARSEVRRIDVSAPRTPALLDARSAR